MKPLFLFAFFAVCAPGMSQGHDISPADALKDVGFIKGDWTGKQEFNTGAAPMVAEVVAHIRDAIGGRYIEEVLTSTVPGRKPSDTRHFLTYDPKLKMYRAWWFNDSSVGAMELQGAVTDKKLVLESKPTATAAGLGTVFRATYENVSVDELGYSLELKDGEQWRTLFRTIYKRSKS